MGAPSRSRSIVTHNKTLTVQEAISFFFSTRSSFTRPSVFSGMRPSCRTSSSDSYGRCRIILFAVAGPIPRTLISSSFLAVFRTLATASDSRSASSETSRSGPDCCSRTRSHTSRCSSAAALEASGSGNKPRRRRPQFCLSKKLYDDAFDFCRANQR